MIGLLILAYGIGAVIRFNIRYGEPLFEKRPAPKQERVEHRLHTGHFNAAHVLLPENAPDYFENASHVALAGAYCVSVSYYLQLLASFTLPQAVTQLMWPQKLMVTVILSSIAIIGLSRGLSGIEKVEKIVVGINLAMITALIAGLFYHNGQALLHGTWHLKAMGFSGDKLQTMRIVMGMLIVVQGFETSRFLGSEHSAFERIKTMRLAQIVSSIIYVLFLGLMALVVSNSGNTNQGGITAIVNLSKIVAPILPILITITAVGSQFSAATADDAGCSGLMASILGSVIPAKYDYLVVSAISIFLTWISNVYEIISYASRAFALFYTLQCIVAILVLKKQPGIPRKKAKAFLFALMGVICAMTCIFGISAE